MRKPPLQIYGFLFACIFCTNTVLATCLNRQNTALPISTPTAAFDIRADGTVVDRTTGLMWMRCLLGQKLDDGRCTGEATYYTWADALTAAQALSAAGYTDWRLPNPKEVVSILEDRCATPALNADLFPIAIFGTWTSTPVPFNLTGGFDDAWFIGENGEMDRNTKYGAAPVLLVRDTR